MTTSYASLFEPLALRSGVTLKNRIVMAPMTNFSSNEDGTVTDSEVEYYARRSNGVSMVITACTNVTPNGKGFPGEFSAVSDDFIPSLKQLADGIKAQGAKAVLQIFHGGRACPPDLVNGDVVSASDVAASQPGAAKPRPLLDSEIRDIIQAFGETTRRAILAGYDGVEIHGANGYLIQQFFSLHTNLREDAWGGSLEKRMAFPLAIVDEVTRVVKEHAKQPFMVGYRFSPEEPETPGITMDDTLSLIDTLADRELDYLHVSLMDYKSYPRRGADTSKTRLELVQAKVGQRVPVIGVGSIHTPEQAVDALNTGTAMIALGREIIMEPDWVEKLQAEDTASIRTTLTKHDQETLLIPDPLWGAIMNTPGWFPVVE